MYIYIYFDTFRNTQKVIDLGKYQQSKNTQSIYLKVQCKTETVGDSYWPSKHLQLKKITKLNIEPPSIPSHTNYFSLSFFIELLKSGLPLTWQMYYSPVKPTKIEYGLFAAYNNNNNVV